MDYPLLQGDDEPEGFENPGKHVDARVCVSVLDGAQRAQANARHLRKVRLRDVQLLAPAGDWFSEIRHVRQSVCSLNVQYIAYFGVKIHFLGRNVNGMCKILRVLMGFSSKLPIFYQSNQIFSIASSHQEEVM